MGPTGSGKTTLLDVLADRKGRRGPSGDVLINGSRRPKNFKCVSGYVVQVSYNLAAALSLSDHNQCHHNIELAT
jgi:ATP-binding cassette subfamily G (WHITE) protein 2